MIQPAKPNNSHSTIGEKPPTIAESSATIKRLSDRRQDKLPLRQLLTGDADEKPKKRKPPDPQNIGFGGFCVCGVLP